MARCTVPARVQRAERMDAGRANHNSYCAAERGADGAARHPYPVVLSLRPESASPYFSASTDIAG
jgi:hypothetical protein